MTTAGEKDVLDPNQIEDALAELVGWEFKGGRFERSFKTGSFMAGIEFIQAIAPVAEEMNHHPDVILTFPKVKIQLWTHTMNAVTTLDVALAKKLTQVAESEGLP